ncbi:MAG: type II toxin-antitoxin system VapC family toxin [Nakamurella sp.]
MLLLDSQVALWLVDDNPRLGARTRQRIGKATIVYVSAGSVWELTIKAMLGKLSLPGQFNELLSAQGVTSLPVSAEHAAGIERFPELLRHDPFDRLLMSQARLERLDLLTADRVLLAGKYDFVLDATD